MSHWAEWRWRCIAGRSFITKKLSKPVSNFSQGGAPTELGFPVLANWVQYLKKVSDKTLKEAITPNGGEVLGKDWDD